MSVSLSIDWPDGNEEEVLLGSYRQLKEGWAVVATRLGLELIPCFCSWIQVTPHNLDQMLGELAVYRAELVHQGLGDEEDTKVVDRLLAALGRLKESKGWRATIG